MRKKLKLYKQDEPKITTTFYKPIDITHQELYDLAGYITTRKLREYEVGFEPSSHDNTLMFIFGSHWRIHIKDPNDDEIPIKFLAVDNEKRKILEIRLEKLLNKSFKKIPKRRRV